MGGGSEVGGGGGGGGGGDVGKDIFNIDDDEFEFVFFILNGLMFLIWLLLFEFIISGDGDGDGESGGILSVKPFWLLLLLLLLFNNRSTSYLSVELISKDDDEPVNGSFEELFAVIALFERPFALFAFVFGFKYSSTLLLSVVLGRGGGGDIGGAGDNSPSAADDKVEIILRGAGIGTDVDDEDDDDDGGGGIGGGDCNCFEFGDVFILFGVSFNW